MLCIVNFRHVESHPFELDEGQRLTKGKAGTGVNGQPREEGRKEEYRRRGLTADEECTNAADLNTAPSADRYIFD